MAEVKKVDAKPRSFFQRLYVEKRRHKRISTIIMADLYLPEPANEVLGRGCITDLSMSGLQVETKDPLTIDKEFSLRFYLPNGMGFENISAKIMRSWQASITHVYGIRFTKIGLVDRLRIWWYITSK